MNTNEYGIEIIGYEKSFKKLKVIKNIDIKVTKGAIHGLIGPNGAGKTTIIKCIIGGFIPDKGKFLINGIEAQSLKAKKMIGYIPESARFPKKISTFNYLKMMCELSGLNSSEAKLQVEKELKKIGLWEKKNFNPNSFSSGMKKKILLAQSLLNKPNVLILDEPAANLDPTSRHELFSEIKRLKEEENATIFISSHILQELQNFVDEITILKNGEVKYFARKKDFEDVNKFEVSTLEIEKTKKILEKKGIEVEINDKSLLIKLEENQNINFLLTIFQEENIKINDIKKIKMDISKIYEDIVIKGKE